MQSEKTSKKQHIALLDSGIGGITVFKKVKEIMPNEDYLYFGDLKNVPYGEKTKEQLVEYTEGILKFFETQGTKAAIMACNTTSAAVYESIKDNYGFKIYPIIQSCAKVIAELDVKRVGVLATQVTIDSGAYTRELKKHNPDLVVFEQACPPWVKIVEEKTQNEPESIEIIKSYLEKMLENNVEKIVLGCTHYPYLLDLLENFAPKDIFIDPAEYFAQYIKEDLEKNNLLKTESSEGSEKFFVSANPQRFKEAASAFYKIDEMPEVV